MSQNKSYLETSEEVKATGIKSNYYQTQLDRPSEWGRIWLNVQFMLRTSLHYSKYCSFCSFEYASELYGQIKWLSLIQFATFMIFGHVCFSDNISCYSSNVVRECRSIYEKINSFWLFKIVENYGRRYEKYSENTYLYLFWLVSFLLKTETDCLVSVMCKVLITNWFIKGYV